MAISERALRVEYCPVIGAARGWRAGRLDQELGEPRSFAGQLGDPWYRRAAQLAPHMSQGHRSRHCRRSGFDRAQLSRIRHLFWNLGDEYLGRTDRRGAATK
jgi:hypothetical protein